MQLSNKEFLGVQSLKELLELAAEANYVGFENTEEVFTGDTVKHILDLCGARWSHSGDPKDPHAELASGRCSSEYVNVPMALRHATLANVLSYHMALRIKQELQRVHYETPASWWVIGSDHSGATFSQNVARWLNATHDFPKKGGEGGTLQIWERFTIQPDEVVIQIEEEMTTGQTIQAVRDGIRKGNSGPVTFAPVAGVLVNRSAVRDIDRKPIVFLAHYKFPFYAPQYCPLCKEGSSRLRPKEHWAELTSAKA